MRSGGSLSSPFGTRISSVWESALPISPSGYTVVNPSSGSASSVSGVPFSSTTRRPRRQPVSFRLRPGAGPSDSTGSSRASPSAPPAPASARTSTERLLQRLLRAGPGGQDVALLDRLVRAEQLDPPQPQAHAERAEHQRPQHPLELGLPAEEVQDEQADPGRRGDAEAHQHQPLGAALLPGQVRAAVPRLPCRLGRLLPRLVLLPAVHALATFRSGSRASAPPAPAGPGRSPRPRTPPAPGPCRRSGRRRG